MKGSGDTVTEYLVMNVMTNMKKSNNFEEMT